MGWVLHWGATTTEAIRRAVQHHQAPLRVLAQRHGINPETVANQNRRDATADRPTGPRPPHSTVLSVQEEAIVAASRKHTMLPLDDCHYALQTAIPHLTRSSLHAACSGMASAAAGGGRHPRSAISTSASPRCTRKKGVSTWSVLFCAAGRAGAGRAGWWREPPPRPRAPSTQPGSRRA